MSLPDEKIQRPVIQAVIFDLDGTLLDTESLSDQAILLALGISQDKVRSNSSGKDGSLIQVPWELKKQLLGLRGSEWAPIVLEYADKNPMWLTNETLGDHTVHLLPTAEQLWNSWERHLNNLCENVQACSGALDLVQQLDQVYQLPLGIATSSRYVAVAKKRINHEELFRPMSVIVAGDDPAVRQGKPAPDIYLEAAQRLQVHPSHCLVFEDALSGVRAAKAAGCTVVAVPDPRFDPAERAVFEAQADLVLPTLVDFDASVFDLQSKRPTPQQEQG